MYQTSLLLFFMLYRSYPNKYNLINMPKNLSVILVDEIDDDFYHCVLFFGAAFGYHEGEGY